MRNILLASILLFASQCFGEEDAKEAPASITTPSAFADQLWLNFSNPTVSLLRYTQAVVEIGAEHDNYSAQNSPGSDAQLPGESLYGLIIYPFDNGVRVSVGTGGSVSQENYDTYNLYDSTTDITASVAVPVHRRVGIGATMDSAFKRSRRDDRTRSGTQLLLIPSLSLFLDSGDIYLSWRRPVTFDTGVTSDGNIKLIGIRKMSADFLLRGELERILSYPNGREDHIALLIGGQIALNDAVKVDSYFKWSQPAANTTPNSSCARGTETLQLGGEWKATGPHTLGADAAYETGSCSTNYDAQHSIHGYYGELHYALQI